jgi:hypothetical protein
MFIAITTSFTVAKITCASTVAGRRARISLPDGAFALTERFLR